VSPTELREARRKLGLSASALARALELGGGGDRTVRRWEAGERDIPGPVRVVIRMLLERAS
jgi:DNA-binding transcriptional regulator YiaG